VYHPVECSEIIERVEHIRGLFRPIKPASDEARRTYERREQRLKDFATNLRRTNGRAMAQMLNELENLCLLTRDGGYKLFGYSLDALRGYDLYLNGSRTHIIESYVYGRDVPVDLPLELASEESFTRTSLLDDLVLRWQENVPIRTLGRSDWHKAGTFYVHVGTEDSLGSSIPPGATVQVEPSTPAEQSLPNPRSMYLLQFPNGYRCCRCVVTRGKLQILSDVRSYLGPEFFTFPGAVRIVGRIRAFALELPALEYTTLRGIWTYEGDADLILPWEHRSRWRLFATKHRRFVRSHAEIELVRQVLQDALRSKVSDRTRRRYRGETASEPHVDALIQMTVEHFARYSDVLRTGGYAFHDAKRYSLETMLQANRWSDLLIPGRSAARPEPQQVWEARRRELVEYASLFAIAFPQPANLADRVVRVGNEVSFQTIEPNLSPGSWILLEERAPSFDPDRDKGKRGWSRPLYALRRGLELFVGHLDRDGDTYALITGNMQKVRNPLVAEELGELRRVCGAAVPV
jgi:hypothetical protein